jgi:hypothetical protein
MGDGDTGGQVSQFILGCNCPESRGIVVQELDILGGLTLRFPSK